MKIRDKTATQLAHKRLKDIFPTLKTLDEGDAALQTILEPLNFGIVADIMITTIEKAHSACLRYAYNEAGATRTVVLVNYLFFVDRLAGVSSTSASEME